MSKLRVYEVARDLSMDNKQLVALFQAVGVTDVRNHMSAVLPEQVDRVKRHLERQANEAAVQERIRPTVVKRRSRKSDGDDASAHVEGGLDVGSDVAAPTHFGGSVAADRTVRRPGGPSGESALEGARVADARVADARATDARAAAESLTSRAPTEVVGGETVVRAASPLGANAPAERTGGSQALEGAAQSSQQAARPEESAVRAAPMTAADVAESAPVKVPEMTTVSEPVARVSETAVVAAAPTATAERGPVAVAEAVVASSASTTVSEPAAAGRTTGLGAPGPAAVVGAPSKEAAVERVSAQETSEERAEPTGGRTAPTVSRTVPTVSAAASPRRSDEGRDGAARPATTRYEGPQRTAQPSLGATATMPREEQRRAEGPGVAVVSREVRGERPLEQRAAASGVPSRAPAQAADSLTPRKKTGIEVWQGRAGVPMPQPPRGTPPRRVQYDAKSTGASAPAPAGGQRGGVSRGQPVASSARPSARGAARHKGIGQLAQRRPGGPPVTQERAAHKKVVKIEGSIGLQALAAKMGAKAGEVLMKLMSLGMTGVNINTDLDSDTAKLLANEFGWEVEDVAVSEAQRLFAAQKVSADAAADGELEPRPPVVTVMGHVDHGKTSLLDYVRKSQVASGEAGGITQHIGAYSVTTSRGSITFLDTPGHAAFTAMRARGAQTTDLVVLVVAADDGVMPQTKEAINHAKAAKVPLVVAINKIDKPGAQPERVRRELSELGLVPEEWGGDTLFCECSALTGQGVEALLDNLVLQSEMLDLRANAKKLASGVVVEAKLDRGRGPVATVLVQSGTLHAGDVLLAGSAYGKVRAMLDDRGKNTQEAGPSIPVAVIGLNEVPSAGDPVHIVKSLKEAQEIAEARRNRERRNILNSHKKISLEELARRMNQSDQLEVKLIVKGDVQGSVEAVSSALSELSTEKVKVTIVHSAVGAITEGDVNLAAAAKAIVIGFNVRPAGKAGTLAQKEGIEIRQYRVIYDVTDDIRATMEGLLAPTLVERMIGKAEVRQLFKVGKSGVVAGCNVVHGVVRRSCSARVVRAGALVWEGKFASLKRFKDDVREVREGFDCGIVLDGFTDFVEGDVIEALETEEVRQTL